MWRLKLKLRDTCAFVGRKITSCGIRCDVTETLRNGEPVLSGLITDQTSFVFRSRLGMFYLCIQMSREMNSFDSLGQVRLRVPALADHNRSPALLGERCLVSRRPL